MGIPMINLNSCIVCGSDSDLNTDLNVVIDGEKIVVRVCDEHADDITPKRAKELYQEKKAEVDKVIEQAKALGLDVSIPTGDNKIAVATESPKPQGPKPASPDGFAPHLDGDRDDGVLSTDEVDDVMQHKIRGVAGNIAGADGSVGNAESHSAYTPEAVLESKLPDGARKGKVKMGVAEGRGGSLIAVPEVRQDGTGTTTIKVTKGGNDEQLQRRFKDHASSQDNHGNNVHSFSQSGYAMRTCTMCKGEGTIRKSKKEGIVACPRCDGSGMFSEV